LPAGQSPASHQAAKPGITSGGEAGNTFMIQNTNLEGLVIYTKGKLVHQAGIETYYFLVSSKRAE